MTQVHVTAVANTQVGILPDVLAPTPTEARHTEVSIAEIRAVRSLN
jgi:hypothetical protein